MCISMSKSFYEKINLLLFVQYESEHVMIWEMTLMTLNVSNHNGALLADHFLDPQSIPRVFYSKNQFLIEIWFE